MQQIKVYFTAKREHADEILASIPDGFHCNSRWIYMLQSGERPVTHWLRENFDDAIASHYVVFFLKPGDNLKTSLVEVGNAIAHGKMIFIAGDRDFEELKGLPHKDIEPWCGFTNQVKITGSLEQTFAFIRKIAFPRNVVHNDGSNNYNG